MSEYTQARLARLQKRISSSSFKADSLLIVKDTNVTYLSGFTGDSTYLLVFADKAFLLSDSRYTIQLSEEAPEITALIRDNKTSLLSLVRQAIANHSGENKKFRLGIEGDGMTYALFTAFKKLLGDFDIDVVPVTGEVEALRAIKDKYELEQIRQAIVVAQKAYRALIATLTPKMTERDAALELEYTMRKLGARKAAFPSIVGVGPRAALPHAVPGNFRIEESDQLLIDWGADVNGYKSDLTRSSITGKLSPKFKKVYSVVYDAQAAAIAAVKPGVKCSKIDAVARDFIAKAGYGKYFGHGLGHSVGLDIHESPSFSPKDDTVLKPGMVITVEPGIYLQDWGGIRIEDDILVTKNGCEVITSALSNRLEDMIYN